MYLETHSPKHLENNSILIVKLYKQCFKNERWVYNSTAVD